MKILQISSNWGRGGPGGVVKDLHYCIINNGDESVIAYGRDRIPSDISSIRIGSKFDNYVHALFTRFFDRAGFGSTLATKKLIKMISANNPDIIHLHNLLGYYINIEVLFSFLKKYNKPVIWTIHDCWPVTGHCINFERINCEKWVAGCYDCKLKKEYPESYFFDLSKRNWVEKREVFTGIPNMVLVCPSKWLKNIIANSFLKDYPIFVFPNGIDLTVFHPVKSNFREKYNLDDKIVLLAVAGVWNQMKGEHLLYEISTKLNENYKIVMVGKSSRKNRPKSIIYIERTNNLEELVKWYSTADLFINPTFGDNFPTVNIEALACGLPIVTNNTGGRVEIAGNKIGRIVQTKTAEEFVDKIYECVSLNISKEECVKEARKYDKNSCFSNYLKLYDQITK